MCAVCKVQFRWLSYPRLGETMAQTQTIKDFNSSSTNYQNLYE